MSKKNYCFFWKNFYYFISDQIATRLVRKPIGRGVLSDYFILYFSYIIISGCGEKLLTRCVARRLALSMFNITNVLSALRRGGTGFFTLRMVLVAFHKKFYEFVNDFMYL